MNSEKPLEMSFLLGFHAFIKTKFFKSVIQLVYFLSAYYESNLYNAALRFRVLDSAKSFWSRQVKMKENVQIFSLHLVRKPGEVGDFYISVLLEVFPLRKWCTGGTG